VSRERAAGRGRFFGVSVPWRTIMGHVNLKFWKAWEERDIEESRPDDLSRGNKRTLIVAGKVRVEAAAKPMLKEAERVTLNENYQQSLKTL
jgi:hypothetical protein